MKLFRKILIFTLVLFLFISIPTFAKTEKKIATVGHQTEMEGELKGISFKVQSDLILSNGKRIIPKNSTVYAYILDTQDERRWHKGGFVVCKLKAYTTPYMDEEKTVDIEKDDLYMVARKYQAIDKKQAAITAAEVTTTTAASFVIPGIDIAYYFTKGMIKKQEGKTRFKSGVSTAYENSIFWFWLKGKPIDLEEDTNISFKEISEKEAQKLVGKIEKRKEKSERMQERKEAVKEFMSY